MKGLPKESPNTPNVRVWPEGYKGSPKGSKTRVSKFSSEYEVAAAETAHRERWRWLERLEYYVFIIGGSALWYFIVKWILKWLKFPLHRHKVEVSLMYIVPILIMISIVYLLDRNFTVTSKED
jgi:hypothetical protein